MTPCASLCPNYFAENVMNPSPKLSPMMVMQDAPVIPVIVLHDPAHAVPMARRRTPGDGDRGGPGALPLQ